MYFLFYYNKMDEDILAKSHFLKKIKKYNLDLFTWDALENNTNDIKKEKYDIKLIVEMYKKWEKRKYITKVDWIGYDKYLKDENYIIKDL